MGLSIADIPNMGKGLRRQDRVEAEGTVRALFENENGVRQELNGKLVDLSPRGAKIEFDREVTPGRFVILNLLSARTRTNAVVRYCRRQWKSWEVGVEFSGPSLAEEKMAMVRKPGPATS
jgi:hypothetical protein